MINTAAGKKLYVVGIGTSAGGLEALERFFSGVKENPNITYLVVQHLSPDYKSHMVELLSKYTVLPVHEARDGMRVEAGNIYLLPPRKNMTIFNQQLYLVEYDRSLGLNLPIDILFNSLAKDQGQNAIACILSGTGSDGTRGLRAIKEMGGMVLAQDDSAKFDGMPRSAVGTQLVDHVAAPEAMPEMIERYAAHPYASDLNTPLQGFAVDASALSKVLAILRDHHGMDFTGYKTNTLTRRIDRRMTLFEYPTLDHYIAYLQQSEAERNILFQEFLIGVTRFFRDPEAYEFLREEIVPDLVIGRERNSPIRIWVPGCSTGEEPYSLAMLIQDYVEKTGSYVDVKIFATDLDARALETASQGRYPESILADLPKKLS